MSFLVFFPAAFWPLLHDCCIILSPSLLPFRTRMKKGENPSSSSALIRFLAAVNDLPRCETRGEVSARFLVFKCSTAREGLLWWRQAAITQLPRLNNSHLGYRYYYTSFPSHRL